MPPNIHDKSGLTGDGAGGLQSLASVEMLTPIGQIVNRGCKGVIGHLFFLKK
jgi:hypothetical protein